MEFKRPSRAACRVGVGRTRPVRALAWARIRTSARRFRLCGDAQRGSAWPFLTDSRQRAERSPACSRPHRVVVSFSTSALRRRPGKALRPAGARGCRGRRARWRTEVRLLQRAVFLEVAKNGANGANGVGFFDAGHDPRRTTTVNASAHVDADRNRLERFGTADRLTRRAEGRMPGARRA